MPVKRETKTVETAEQRQARFSTEEMLERAGAGPKAVAKERRRVVALIELDRDLKPDEQAEFDRLTERPVTRRRYSRQLVAAIDQRQRDHRGETRDESALVIIREQSDARHRRQERRAVAKRTRKRVRAKATLICTPVTVAAAVHRRPAQEPAKAMASFEEAEPLRRRSRVGIVAQFDLYGNRVD